MDACCQLAHLITPLNHNRLGQIAGGNSANLCQQLLQRLNQHLTQAKPAANNHRKHRNTNRGQQPHHLFKGFLVLRHSLIGKLGLTRTPFVVTLLHRDLFLLNVLFKHPFQVTRLQTFYHRLQAVFVVSVIGFKRVAHGFVKTRRGWQMVIDFKVAIGFR